MYRYILRESCSQFDSLPLTSLTRASHAERTRRRRQRRAAARARVGRRRDCAHRARHRRSARAATRHGAGPSFFRFLRSFLWFAYLLFAPSFEQLARLLRRDAATARPATDYARLKEGAIVLLKAAKAAACSGAERSAACAARRRDELDEVGEIIFGRQVRCCFLLFA